MRINITVVVKVVCDNNVINNLHTNIRALPHGRCDDGAVGRTTERHRSFVATPTLRSRNARPSTPLLYKNNSYKLQVIPVAPAILSFNIA